MTGKGKRGDELTRRKPAAVTRRSRLRGSRRAGSAESRLARARALPRVLCARASARKTRRPRALFEKKKKSASIYSIIYSTETCGAAATC